MVLQTICRVFFCLSELMDTIIADWLNSKVTDRLSR
jgi:hypothetical protein